MCKKKYLVGVVGVYFSGWGVSLWKVVLLVMV